MERHHLACTESISALGNQLANLRFEGAHGHEFCEDDVDYYQNREKHGCHLTQAGQLMPPLELDALETRQLVMPRPEKAQSIPEHQDVLFN